MTLQPAKSVAPKASPSLMGAIKNIGRGIYGATAKFANYSAATPTTTTRTSGLTGTNLNSTISQIQRVGMNWTAEDVFKNSCIAAAYILQRINYCSSQITYIPATGDTGLDADIKTYLHGSDGTGGVFGDMGVDCSMQDAFSRTADIETPIRGDGGLIFWEDSSQNIRTIEWSADQLGEIYNFTLPRTTSLAMGRDGALVETSGNDLVYLSGRYFRGPDCVAYKIYERTNSWYANPIIYPAHDVVYFRDPANFRGVRGFTKFSTAIQHMEKGEALFQTGMDAALRQAKTAMMVWNNRGQPDENTFATYEDVNGISGQMTYAERIPNGPLTEYFYTGDDAKFVSPDSPGPELIAGVETSDERVALALGMNYAFLISATKVGGAPSRLEINKAAKELARIQNTIHRPRLRKIKDVTLLNAIRRGIFRPIPGILNGRWQLPISPSVDAFYDAKENIAMARSGFEAPQDIIAETNRDAEDIIRKKTQWAVNIAIAVAKANKSLPAGCEPITKEDIAQISDNPQQQANAQATDANGKVIGDSVARPAAKLAAYHGDVTIGDLPKDTQDSIASILGTNGHTSSLRAVKYGMVASELERMADPHNLESAQHHIRYCPNGSCADEVHADNEKHILVNNGRVVDGHHYLAKAIKGKVTKSLPVIDLTPTRFQSAKLSEFDESKHPRIQGGDHAGEFTSTGFNSSSRPNKELKAPYYLSRDSEYSKNFGKHTQEVTIAPKKSLDITHLDARDSTALDLKYELEKSGISTKGMSFSEDDEVAQSLFQNREEIAKRSKKVGFDSIKLNEYFEGGGESETIMVLDDSIFRKRIRNG